MVVPAPSREVLWHTILSNPSRNRGPQIRTIPARRSSRCWGRVSRRSFLSHLGAAGVAATAKPLLAAATPVVAPEEETTGVPGAVPVTLNVNGKDHALRIEPRLRCLIVCARVCSCRGRKKGCDHGPLRSLYGSRQWPQGELLFVVCDDASGRPDHHHRRHRPARSSSSDAGCLRRTRWLSVRLLHLGSDHVGCGSVEGAVRSHR